MSAKASIPPPNPAIPTLPTVATLDPNFATPSAATSALDLAPALPATSLAFAASCSANLPSAVYVSVVAPSRPTFSRDSFNCGLLMVLFQHPLLLLMFLLLLLVHLRNLQNY